MACTVSSQVAGALHHTESFIARPKLLTQHQHIHSHKVSRGWQAPRPQRRVAVAAIKIDRRQHLEQAYKRQQEDEALLAEADVTCPVECVREVRTCKEFDHVLEEAQAHNQLVVVDFYNSSCGACKYIAPQFVKLCKQTGGGGESDIDPVSFVKHNVRDEYDDLTDIAQLYGIKVVPMFAFFKDGARVDQFPTRDRKRLAGTIEKLTGMQILK
eukprot:jgi/Chlat1/1015/Chrsp109S01444